LSRSGRRWPGRISAERSAAGSRSPSCGSRRPLGAALEPERAVAQDGRGVAPLERPLERAAYHARDPGVGSQHGGEVDRLGPEVDLALRGGAARPSPGQQRGDAGDGGPALDPALRQRRAQRVERQPAVGEPGGEGRPAEVGPGVAGTFQPAVERDGAAGEQVGRRGPAQGAVELPREPPRQPGVGRDQPRLGEQRPEAQPLGRERQGRLGRVGAEARGLDPAAHPALGRLDRERVEREPAVGEPGLRGDAAEIQPRHARRVEPAREGERAAGQELGGRGAAQGALDPAREPAAEPPLRRDDGRD
jgi:hypothetical protein